MVDFCYLTEHRVVVRPDDGHRVEADGEAQVGRSLFHGNLEESFSPRKIAREGDMEVEHQQSRREGDDGLAEGQYPFVGN
jgi:hypothetical protein